MATITVRRAVVMTVAALTIGAGGGWFATRTIADRELRGMILMHELATANLCANGLKLEAAHRNERLVMLLEQQLDSALEEATLMVDEGAPLYPGTSGTLSECVRRASAHYAMTNATAKKQAADLLLARLAGER